MHTTTIVKRHRTVEAYDEIKLMRSIYAACLAVRTPAGEAELTAKRIAKDLESWLQKKPEVTSHDIRTHAGTLLHTYNPHAAYTYKHHGTVH
jgi:transcriptional regulator NrdR family protein